MRKILYFILGLSLLAVSCIKPNGCDPAQMTAAITAQRNGVSWRPLFVKGTLSAADSLTLSATSGSANSGLYNKVDSLAFTFFCTGTGNYKLSSNQVFYATFASTGLNKYKIDTTYNNALNITGYQSLDNASTMNPNQIKITGTFNIKFIDPNNSAGISFSGGTFNTVVNQ
jgi:hypothetical protein